MVKREGVFFSRKRANDDLGRGREQNGISQAPPPTSAPPPLPLLLCISDCLSIPASSWFLFRFSFYGTDHKWTCVQEFGIFGDAKLHLYPGT